jgi:thioredoxin reductase (NADPH)
MLAPAEADGPLVEVEADFVLLLVGYEADMNLCRLAGVELRGPAQAPVFDPQTMLTSVPGVYVAGTLTAGSQENYRVFIENSHIHVARIVAHLKGQAPPAEVTPAPVIEMPES